jgi:GH15 family glucan-1,4-alpha-glucosidase
MHGVEAIENHAIIGDLNTIALVALNGTIDFMCFPRFDSPSVFAALLDPERGGHFSFTAEFDGARHKQLYLPDSNILLTRFLSKDGVIEISDFMPVEDTGNSHNLVRRVKCVRGKARVRMVCAPRFNYARSPHRIERSGNDVIFISEGKDKCQLRLRSQCRSRLTTVMRKQHSLFLRMNPLLSCLRTRARISTAIRMRT